MQFDNVFDDDEQQNLEDQLKTTKLYVVGRAQTKEFPLEATQSDEEPLDWSYFFPMPSADVYKALMDSLGNTQLRKEMRTFFKYENKFDHPMDGFQERIWKPMVDENLKTFTPLKANAHFQDLGNGGTYAFDIRIMKEKPIKERGLDRYGGLTHKNAFQFIEMLKKSLFSIFPKEVLRVMFQGPLNSNDTRTGVFYSKNDITDVLNASGQEDSFLPLRAYRRANGKLNAKVQKSADGTITIKIMKTTRTEAAAARTEAAAVELPIQENPVRRQSNRLLKKEVRGGEEDTDDVQREETDEQDHFTNSPTSRHR